MTKQFIIKKVCREEQRPAYSYKIDEYFEDFVHENILDYFKVIINTKWTCILSIMYYNNEENFPSGINFYEPQKIEEEKIKIYPVAISLNNVFANNTPLENIIGLYYQAISLFFKNFYNKVSEDVLVELKDKLDWDYLLSTPYPAAFEDQKYVGDDQLS